MEEVRKRPKEEEQLELDEEEEDIDLIVDVLYVVEGESVELEVVGNYYAIRRRLRLNADDQVVGVCSYYCQNYSEAVVFANGDGGGGGAVLHRPATFVGYRNPYLLPKTKKVIQ